MRNIQKQLCGIALLLFGLIIAVASLALNRMMALLGCAVGLFGLARELPDTHMWTGRQKLLRKRKQPDMGEDKEKTDADDNGK